MARGLRTVVFLQQLVIPASCLTCCRTCHRTFLHGLSHLHHLSSEHLLPHSARSGLDQETLRDSRRSGGYTKSASPTGFDPKLTQSDDVEARRIELDQNPGTDPQPRRIELDRNIGTDPKEIPERILGDDYQNPKTEDTKETEQFGVNMPHVQSRIHSDYDSAESIANSDILKMENYEKCWPHRCMHMGEEKIWVLFTASPTLQNNLD